MSKKVLVIDDEEDIRQLIKNRLEGNGWNVTTAIDGIDGIAKLDDERPDLIVLDLIMPRLNGFTFVKTIKDYKDFRSIPILLLTVHLEDSQLFRKGDINIILLKPVNSDELVVKVNELLNGHPVQESSLN